MAGKHHEVAVSVTNTMKLLSASNWQAWKARLQFAQQDAVSHDLDGGIRARAPLVPHLHATSADVRV